MNSDRIVRSLALLTILFFGFVSCSDSGPEICVLMQVQEKTSYAPGSGISGNTLVTDFGYAGAQISELSSYYDDTPDDKQNLSLVLDANNRLIRGEDVANETVIDLTYDTDGKMTELTQAVKGIIRERSVYEYNSASQLVKITYYSLRLSVMTEALRVTYEYPNEKTKNYNVKKFFYPQQSSPVYVSQFEWDSKKSPYHGLPFLLTLDRGENNITKITSTYPATSTYPEFVLMEDYLYVYNSNGLPSKRTHTRETPSKFTEEITYEYNCKK